MTTAAEIERIARTWLGTPWVVAGAQKGAGCNCLGFLGGVAREAGLKRLVWAFERYEGYALPPEPLTLIRGLMAHLDRVDLQDAGQGDVILYRLSGRYQHVGLVTGRASVIVADRSAGAVVEQNMPRRPAGVFRIREVIRG